MNAELVDSAIMVITSTASNTMKWEDIEAMVEDEKQRMDNHVAAIIDSLELKFNRMYIKLYDETPVRIPIDLGQTALSNARALYTTRKKARPKEEKTKFVADKALKSAADAIKQASAKIPVVAAPHKARKQFWYEKFHWFISTDGIIVVGGRDMHQNELLVKKHMEPNEIYVHADMHGAPSVIVKSQEPVPATMEQAGCMALCLSKAWKDKIVTSAWWVKADQVSKSAPSGEYLSTGSFMIRARKNHLFPSQLVYGFGLLLKTEDEEKLKAEVNQNEVILFVLLVAASYPVLLDYKFKAKLVPGTTKRGKSSKALKDTFLKQDQHEKKIIKNRGNYRFGRKK
jgi:predicted ribosome quality control (RQC) complex YloA/Tae2 family protein